MNITEFIRRLEPTGVKSRGNYWMAKCPGHDDRVESLSISEGNDGRILLTCFGPCDSEHVLKSMGLRFSDAFVDDRPRPGEKKIVARYDYRDAAGVLLYQAVRFEPKEFRQRKPNGAGGWDWKTSDVLEKVLYRLPALLDADPKTPVFVVEGEKDVDRLRNLGVLATTNVGGAKKWRSEYTQTLRGRRVIILPDNDEAGHEHAEIVAKALTGVAASVQIVKLPGLDDKQDISDWLDMGGTVAMLANLIGDAIPITGQAFQWAPDRLGGERFERIEYGKTALSFGVKYLDDALGGITSRDLVLFGAKTGVGKTALATITALHNCQQGRRVHYFALEAEDREIERRMKFQLVANAYYRNGAERPPIRYLDWYMGKLDRELAQYEKQADERLNHVLANLHTFYRLDSFTSDDFCRQLEEIKGDTDLVILDHLHYVDSADENENRGYKKTVKQIRDAALRVGKPTIIVAHVRKGDRRNEPLIPSVEDFHGSSDIPKMATKAIMIAGAYDTPNPIPFLWNTYIQISKCRLDSAATRYAALVAFDSRHNLYQDAYTLGRLTEAGRKFEAVPITEAPAWASFGVPE
jgi:hypothetical protein